MKQPQYSPLSVAEQTVSLFAVNNGYVDDVELKKVVDFEHALHSYVRSAHAALLAKINETGDYNDEIEAELSKALKSFKSEHTW
jgi:F-type H+-transporting ATPase subunit alpha